MYKKRLAGIVIVVVALFTLVVSRVNAQSPDDVALWPFDPSQYYYIMYFNYYPGQRVTPCLDGGSVGSCYWLYQFSENSCNNGESPSPCAVVPDYDDNSILNMNFQNTHGYAQASDDSLIDRFYWNTQTSEWLSVGGPYIGPSAHELNRLWSEYSFSESVSSNMFPWFYQPYADIPITDFIIPYNLSSFLASGQPPGVATGSGSIVNRACVVGDLYTDPDPGGVGLDHLWWSFKRWFWVTFSPVCFMDLSTLTPIQNTFLTKAPFAYINAISATESASLVEDSNLSLTLPIMGTNYVWNASSSGVMSVFVGFKAFLAVLVWLIFIVYLWNLHNRIITN